MVDGRCGAGWANDFMRAAVTVFAGGGGGLSGAGFAGVNAARVGGLRVSVALGTGDFLRRGFVGETLYVGVAIDAMKEPAMHRVLELVLIDVKADDRAVDVLSEGGVAVAGEAVSVLELLRGKCG